MLSQHCCSLHWAGQMGFGGLISSFGLGDLGTLLQPLVSWGHLRTSFIVLLHLCWPQAQVPSLGMMLLLAKGARDQQQ